jgi:ABC-2 type transport system ATP-binding protein
MENNREIINLYKELSDCLVEQVGQDKYRIISRDGKSLRGATLKQIKFYVSKHKYSLKNKKIIFNKKQTFHKTLQNPKDGLKVFHKKYGKKYPILYVDGLTKYYGKNKTPTISNVNFIIKPGEFHAFIGANGAGKTTTIKSIITAYSNWNGTIMINGLKNTDINSKKYIAYFPERAEFPESISTYNYLF